MPGDIVDDLAADAEYVEICRNAAWAERPWSEATLHWDPVARAFNWPAGWPEGVDGEAFVRQRLDDALASTRPAAGPAADDGDVSPSVRRLREMLR